MMNRPLELDVVVIGAGTAGLAAAKSAHAEGARVAVVDHGPLGTLCARKGCMPSKAILASARALDRARRLPSLGIEHTGDPKLDWQQTRARERALVDGFVRSIVENTTSSTNFSLVRGKASFGEDGLLHVDGRFEGGDGAESVLSARGWVVAAGSLPVVPNVPGLADIPFLISDDIFDLDAIPKSVAVIGAGAIAVELGQFLARAGANVHLIGNDDTLAGLGAGDLQDALSEPLTRDLELHLRSKITHIERHASGITVRLESSGKTEELHVEKILVAAGRQPNIASLGLNRMGVQIENGAPKHDEFLRTTHENIFVAGDAAGNPAILHVASRQGTTAGRNAAHPEKLERPVDDEKLRIVFSDPMVATVGLDPVSAKAEGLDTCVATRRWSEQGRARLMGETEGMAELTVDCRTRKILGCRIVGAEADVLIHLAAYALRFEATVDDLLTLPHYHPTVAEMFPSLAERIVAKLDTSTYVCAVAPSAELQ